MPERHRDPLVGMDFLRWLAALPALWDPQLMARRLERMHPATLFNCRPDPLGRNRHIDVADPVGAP
jgi:hypothetical protein